MKFRRQVLSVPEGNPISGAQVTLTRQDDNAVEATGTSDSDGWVEIETNGAPGNCWIQIDQGNGRRFDDSRSVRPYGSMNPGELVDLLNVLIPDGILPYGDSFQATAGTTTLTVGTGGAIVNGVVGIWYTTTTITPGADGARMLVVQWSGTGRLRLLDVEYSASPTDQLPLATYTVSSGIISSVVGVGTPAVGAIRGGYGSVTGVARATSGGTSSASGEDTGLSVTLTLRTGVAYTIYAEGSVIGSGNDGAIAVEVDGNLSSYQSAPGDNQVTLINSHARTKTGGSCVVRLYDRTDTLIAGWQLQATYGPTFNSLDMSSPSQVAVDGTGRILIADTGNDRLVILTSGGAYSTGITALTGITGVCVDTSNNIYTLSESAADVRLRKYNSSLTLQWTDTFGDDGGQGHATTDGTHVWACDAINRKVFKRLCSTGAAVSSFGSAGTGNSQFGLGGPYGITNDGTHLYVADPGNDRIQKFLMSTGGYVTQWSVADPVGVAVDASGDIVVTRGGTAAVRSYTNVGVFIDQFTQSGATGIGIATGDVIWISNTTAGTIVKWDEVSSSFSWQAGLLTAIAIPR